MAPPPYGPYANWRDRPVPKHGDPWRHKENLADSRKYWAEVQAKGDRQRAERAAREKAAHKKSRRGQEERAKRKCKKWLPRFLAEDKKKGRAKKKRFNYLFRKVRKWCHLSWGRTGRSKERPIIIR